MEDGPEGWGGAMPLGHFCKPVPKPLHRPSASLEMLLAFAVPSTRRDLIPIDLDERLWDPQPTYPLLRGSSVSAYFVPTGMGF